MSTIMGFTLVTALLDEPTASPFASVMPEHKVFGGTPVGVCGWPSVVEMYGCTGTLLSDRLVLYAAHCGDIAKVRFGENIDSPTHEIATIWCQPHPEHDAILRNGRDLALCLLESAIEVPIIPLARSCNTGSLNIGDELTIVGYGRSENNPVGGRKISATVMITELSRREVRAGGDGVDTCSGDSGAPAFARTKEGGYVLAAVTARGQECGSGGVYTLVNNDMNWIEDILRARSAEWVFDSPPGSSPVMPDASTGSWETGCIAVDALIVDVHATCEDDSSCSVSGMSTPRDLRAHALIFIVFVLGTPVLRYALFSIPRWSRDSERRKRVGEPHLGG